MQLWDALRKSQDRLAIHRKRDVVAEFDGWRLNFMCYVDRQTERVRIHVAAGDNWEPYTIGEWNFELNNRREENE